jgi:hypothetical protein
MTLLERVYKKSTTKTLAAAARFRTSLLTNTDLEQAEFKKKTPSGVLTPYGGKAQSRPPVGAEIVLSSSAETSSFLQRQKVKKWTPAIVKNSVSSMMETQNILTSDSRRDRANQ